MSATKKAGAKKAGAKPTAKRSARPAARKTATKKAPIGRVRGKAASKHPRVSDALLDTLVQKATEVRANAHAPYSRYAVGAAIATADGRVFAGCNVENASYGATICAERGAIMQMVASGARDPIACAVVTGDPEGASPCGICRQVLAEFTTDMPVVLVGLGSPEGESGRVVSLADLLPLAFELSH